jgi:hypothetical protein
MLKPERYQAIREEFTQAGCSLLTTYEEAVVMNVQPGRLRLRFLGTCGHESEAYYTNFHNRRTGAICKACVLAKSKISLRKRERTQLFIQETTTIYYISNILSKSFTVERTPEGCIMDLLLRPKDSTKDEWIPIQVKSTKGDCHSMYAFNNIKSEYKDSLLLCHAVSDNKLWLIPFNELPTIQKLNISYKCRSKYAKYFLEDHSLLTTKMETYKDQYSLVDFKTTTTPVCIYQRREQEYAQKRKQCISFMEFAESSVQGEIFDFTVNGRKVQEKVVGLKTGKTHSLMFTLACNNGIMKNMKRRSFRTYRLGENDMYWFNSSINDFFWIVPEIVLYEKGYLSDKDTSKAVAHFMIDIRKQTWLDEYKFDYSGLTESCVSRIKGIFSIL